MHLKPAWTPAGGTRAQPGAGRRGVPPRGVASPGRAGTRHPGNLAWPQARAALRAAAGRGCGASAAHHGGETRLQVPAVPIRARRTPIPAAGQGRLGNSGESGPPAGERLSTWLTPKPTGSAGVGGPGPLGSFHGGSGWGVPAPQREPIVQVSSEGRLGGALGPCMAPQNT